MRKVILIANRTTNVLREENCDYIGVDRGAMYCLENNISMLCALGDFDSLSKEQFDTLKNETKLVCLPCRKNETDGEYAIRYAHSLGYDEIDVYGVTGGRLDHFLTIFNLMKHSDISFRMIDEQNIMYCLNTGKHTIHKKNTYLSIFPCEDLNITLTGVEYPLNDVHVCEKDLYLVSNEIIDDVAHIQIDGKVCIVESKDA